MIKLTFYLLISYHLSGAKPAVISLTLWCLALSTAINIFFSVQTNPHVSKLHIQYFDFSFKLSAFQKHVRFTVWIKMTEAASSSKWRTPLTSEQYPHIKRGQYSHLTETDKELLSKLVGGRACMSGSELDDANIDWLKIYRGKLRTPDTVT